MGSKRLTTEIFIQRSILIHGDLYGYDKSVYVNAKTKVEIYCKECKEYFWQLPGNHMSGIGCRKCGTKSFISKQSHNEEIFIKRAINIHGDLYGYGGVVYVNAKTKVKIYCKQCERYFWQMPDKHINAKQGCIICKNKQNGINCRLSLTNVIEECSKLYNNKFDYSKTTEISKDKLIKFICPVHGMVEDSVFNHRHHKGCRICSKESFILGQLNEIYDMSKFEIDFSNYKNVRTLLNIRCTVCGETFNRCIELFKMGFGCPNCRKQFPPTQKCKWSPELLIKRSKEIHGENSFSYIDVNIRTIKDKITLKCNKCGNIFKTTADVHIHVGSKFKNKGCVKCSKRYTTEEFKTLSKEKNPFYKFFIYNSIEYIHSKCPVKIYCTLCNSYFYQRPDLHLAGNGCNNCSKSEGERMIMGLLNEMNIDYICQKTFTGCINKSLLYYDFYLPKYNLCIEFDGMQHYKPIEFFGGVNSLKHTQINDKIKNQYCFDNNIDLIRIPYWDFDIIEAILKEHLSK